MTTFFDFIYKKRLLWLLLVLSVAIFLDQASKIWAQNTLSEPYEMVEEGKTVTYYYPTKVIEIIPNSINFIYKENPAAAFSITRSLPDWFRRPMLITVSILATIFFLVWYFRLREKDGFLLMSFSFILSGAIGNLLDRIRLGYVIDFIDAYLGFIESYSHLHWPTFNVADSFIVAGAIGVFLRTLKPVKNSSLNNV